MASRLGVLLKEYVAASPSSLRVSKNSINRIEMRGESMRKKRNPPQDEKKE
jgi:hypothetical protein